MNISPNRLYRVSPKNGIEVLRIFRETTHSYFIGWGVGTGACYVSKKSKIYTTDRQRAIEAYKPILAAKIKETSDRLATMMAQLDALNDGDEEAIRRTDAIPQPLEMAPRR